MLRRRVFKKKLKWLLLSSGNPSCSVDCEERAREKSDKVNVTEGRRGEGHVKTLPIHLGTEKKNYYI